MALSELLSLARQLLHFAEPLMSLYVPPGHATQPVRPVEFWKEPRRQETHELRSSSACTDPAAHRMGATEPVGHALPGGHGKHSN